jgi:hypothetical protein
MPATNGAAITKMSADKETEKRTGDEPVEISPQEETKADTPSTNATSGFSLSLSLSLSLFSLSVCVCVCSFGTNPLNLIVFSCVSFRGAIRVLEDTNGGECGRQELCQ